MFEAYDDNALQRISPQLLRDYLQGAGWVFHEPYGAYAEIYRAPSGKMALVPALQESEFYPIRVRELLAAIATADNLNEPALLNDLRYHGRDVARLIAPTESERDTLPPSEFNSIASGAQEVWEGAVRALGLSASQQAEYWDTAGFGHTEPGSFVFTMCSPILMKLEEQLGLMPEEKSTARRVTVQLRTSVVATRSALTQLQNGNDDAFDKATERGITLATCQGISKTVAQLEEVRWEIVEAGWPGYPIRERAKVAFHRSDTPLLDQAAEAIKREKWVVEPSTVKIVGYINAFKKPQHKEEGDATMKPVDWSGPSIQGKPGEQTVHIVLGLDQYEIAWNLHKADQNAIALGTVVQTGPKTWYLRDSQISQAPT